MQLGSLCKFKIIETSKRSTVITAFSRKFVIIPQKTCLLHSTLQPSRRTNRTWMELLHPAAEIDGPMLENRVTSGGSGFDMNL